MTILLYDGNCALCRSAISRFKSMSLLEGIQSVPWQGHSNNDPMLAERIKSEFLLLEPDQVLGGFYAIARLLEERFPSTKTLFNVPGVLPIGQTFYKIVSLNRRIIAPSGNIACTCDPPFHLGYRLGLWALLLFVAFAGSAVFGASLAVLHPDKTFFDTAWQLTLAAGSGWAVNFLVFIPLICKRYWEFIQQCLIIMAIGIFWLMPIASINWLGSLLGLSNHFLLQVTILGVAANSLIMFLSLRRRATTLGFPQWVPWVWLLLLELAGVPLFVYFKLFT